LEPFLLAHAHGSRRAMFHLANLTSTRIRWPESPVWARGASLLQLVLDRRTETPEKRDPEASWRSGDAADCKSVYTGSIPVEASIPFSSELILLPVPGMHMNGVERRFRVSRSYWGRPACLGAAQA